jgi:hypothetical protein
MGHWQLLERIFTVETLMTPREDLLVWDRVEPIEHVWAEADKLKIDTIPVTGKKNGQIDAVLQRGMDDPVPLTYDWLITRDSSVPGLIKVLEERKKQCLLVLAGQDVVGLVTPADLNKLAARTYFYNVLAELEMTLAGHVRRLFPEKEKDKLLETLKPKKKRLEEIARKVQASKYEIDVVHALYLPEMISLIRSDHILWSRMGFPSGDEEGTAIKRVKDFRNNIMHPENPLLSNGTGIDELKKSIDQLEITLSNMKETPIASNL